MLDNPEPTMSFYNVIAQTFGVLFAVILLVIVMLWAVRKFGIGKYISGGLNNSSFKIIGRLTIGPKQSIIAVKILDKYYVLGSSESSVTTLAGPFDEEKWGEFETKNLSGKTVNRSNFFNVLKTSIAKKNS